MRILLLAATEAEIKSFIAGNKQVDVLITGIGVPACMYKLQKKIQQAKYDLIIQAGIAGSFEHGIPLGNTVFVKKDCFADIGFEENEDYTPVFKTSLAHKDDFPFIDGWLQQVDAHLNLLQLPVADAITVNRVSDSKLQALQYKNAFAAHIESMEGAALHYVCLQEKIPFMQIRSVSNYVGERDKTKWKLKEAVENLNTVLIKLINSLNKKSGS